MADIPLGVFQPVHFNYVHKYIYHSASDAPAVGRGRHGREQTCRSASGPSAVAQARPVRPRADGDLHLDVVVPDDRSLRPSVLDEFDDAEPGEFGDVVVDPAHVTFHVLGAEKTL